MPKSSLTLFNFVIIASNQHLSSIKGPYMSLFHAHVNKYASYYKAADDAPRAPSAPQFRSTGGGRFTKELIKTVGKFVPDLIEFASPGVLSKLPSPAGVAGNINALPGTSTRSIPNNIRGITNLPKPVVHGATPAPIAYVGPDVPASSSLIT